MNRSAAALVKAAEARLLEPEVYEALPVLRLTRLRVEPDELQPTDVAEPRDPDDTDRRLMVERRTPATATVVRGRRTDDVPPGTLVAFVALWVDDGSPEVLARHRGGTWRPVGYRDLVAELRTGQRPETAEDRITALLRAVFVGVEPATRQQSNLPIPA